MLARINILCYLKNLLKRLIYTERSPEKLALSFSIGIFIAFSPLIGFHNIMIFIFSWFFKLNTMTTFAVAHINNPLTAIPLFSSCYLFGKWFLTEFLGLTIKFVNPSWINYISTNLNYYLGVPKICYWTFFIGGNILGIILSIMLYPVMKFVFKKLLNEINQLA